MDNKKTIAICVLFFSFFASCNRPWRPVSEIPTPPDSKIEGFRGILSGGGEGRYWKGRYTPDERYGTFNILFHFRERSVTIHSDDVTYRKERDEGVLYDVEEGLTSDKLTFSSYCIFHEMSENRSGEFEFSIGLAEGQSRDDEEASQLLLESVVDGFNDLTTFSIVAIDEAEFRASLKEIEKIRDFMDDVELLEDSRVNLITSEGFGMEVPIDINTNGRVITFFSETDAFGIYEEKGYPFSPLVSDDHLPALVFTTEEAVGVSVYSGGREFPFGDRLVLRGITSEETESYCTKKVYSATVVFPGLDGGAAPFAMTSGGSIGDSEEVERLFRSGILLREAEIVYGGGLFGLGGRLRRGRL